MFYLPFATVPKARPRVTKNGTFLPARYRAWRLRAEGEFTVQAQQMATPIKRANIEIVLGGAGRGDIDNIAGAILDALVGAKVLLDDRLSCVPSLQIRHEKGDKTGAKILITEL